MSGLGLKIIGPVIQIISTGFSTFLIYRWIYLGLGAEIFGLWVVCLSYCSLIKLADFGLTSALATEIAKIRLSCEWGRVTKSLRDYVLLIVVFTLLAFLLVVGLSNLFVESFFGGVDAWLIKNIFILSLIFTFSQILLNMFSSVMDGLGEYATRSFVVIFYNTCVIVFSYFSISIYGLKGFVFVSIWMVVCCCTIYTIFIYLLLRREKPALEKWSLLFCDLNLISRVKRNANHFGINVTAVSFDPLVKYIIFSNGGATLVALYEVAGKIPAFCRTLVGEGCRFLVYRSAQKTAYFREAPSVKESNEDYEWFANLLICSSYVFAIATLNLPLLLKAWVGVVESRTLFAAFSLSLMWYVNSLASVSFFKDLGGGDQRIARNFQVGTALLSMFAAILFGFYIDSFYSIIGLALALTCCSLIFIIKCELIGIKYFLSMMYLCKVNYLFPIFAVLVAFFYSFLALFFHNNFFSCIVAPCFSLVALFMFSKYLFACYKES